MTIHRLAWDIWVIALLVRGNYHQDTSAESKRGQKVIVGGKIDPLLTVREVARLLNIHCNTVRRWSDQGIIRSYRISIRGDRRFKREDIAQFITKLNAR
jgi:excisionase family DNA binding protein